MKKFISVLIILLCAASGFAQNAWINEFHYDNASTDVGEFVEIVIEDPGSWDLSLFQVDLYNGNGGVTYNSETINNFTVGTTSGNYTFYYWDLPSNGIQNGSPDGLALSYNGSVIPGQFLSYEGIVDATDGPAAGTSSTDIGVSEPGTDPVGYSLQLGGTGTQYSDFTWNAPAPETKGALNIGQTLSSGSTSVINVTPALLSDFSYLEGAGPSASQSYELSGTGLDPASGNIVVTGSADFEVSSDDITFSGVLNIPYTSGTLSATNIYVRLKAGLPLGDYSGEMISNEGGSAPTQSVLCSGAVVKGEPTNHVTGFTGVLGFPDYYYVDLSWTDATGGIVPDGYLVKRSTIDFSSIIDPVDGTTETNSYSVQNIAQGIQAAEFTGYADTTYYFKIYPYTNEGAFIDYKTDGSVPQFTITSASAPSFPVIENFEYTTGSFLTDDGWIAHSGGGTNPISVNDTALSYSGYVNSGLGKSVTLTTSGEDVNRAFHKTVSGKVYASFMVNVSEAQLNGDYFFNLGPENTSSLYYGRVYVRKALNDNLAFGLSKSSTNSTTLPVYTDSVYSLNQTYLLVMSYEFSDPEVDTVKLWVNPDLSGDEPAPDLVHSEAVSDAESLGMFALRQGYYVNAASLVLGGIRVSDTWVAQNTTTFPLSVDVSNGWNMVSVPGTNPAGMNVGDWWSDLTGTVYKFVPGSGYSAVTTTTPKEGYWLKNSVTETYSYPAIEIVAHDPINAIAGWNMIGGYENAVDPAALTTVPSGQIVYPLYKFVPGSGYATATSIDPGYGYWVKVSSDCQINIPNAAAKGQQKVAEMFSKDWGKITLTDASGSSYTLYAVKGEVDLNKYELPPLPPSGIFDVRYGSGRVAENISSSSQSIEMRGMTYPVRVKVEGMGIRLQDVTGKEINTSLKTGEEISISNSSINKIMVTGELIPVEYALEQNYPNPFNPATTIRFSLPEASEVMLTIYNALGQKVTELVNGKLEAGNYSYEWNAKNVATGMYIYELRAGKFVSIKKMMLLK